MRQGNDVERLMSLRDQPVVGSEGDKIGNLEAVYYDPATGAAEWLGIQTGLLGMKRVLAPVQGSSVQGVEGDATIRVAYPKDQVKDSPNVGSDEISEEEERDLYSYYSLGVSERRSETQLPSEGGEIRTGQAGYAGPGAAGDEGVTLHEEQMRVGKREEVRGRARLRKWVESDTASADVTLRRETAHVEREQLDRAAPGAHLGNEEVEVTLHEEEPVVQKETIARERVTLEPETETRQETVTGDVRREHAEVEGDEESPGRDVRDEEWRRKAS